MQFFFLLRIPAECPLSYGKICVSHFLQVSQWQSPCDRGDLHPIFYKSVSDSLPVTEETCIPFSTSQSVTVSLWQRRLVSIFYKSVSDSLPVTEQDLYPIFYKSVSDSLPVTEETLLYTILLIKLIPLRDWLAECHFQTVHEAPSVLKV